MTGLAQRILLRLKEITTVHRDNAQSHETSAA